MSFTNNIHICIRSSEKVFATLCNDGGVCRTAPATPGLLNTHTQKYPEGKEIVYKKCFWKLPLAPVNWLHNIINIVNYIGSDQQWQEETEY